VPLNETDPKYIDVSEPAHGQAAMGAQPAVLMSPTFEDSEDLRDEDAHGDERRQAVVSEQAHRLRLDRWLVAMAPEFSRTYLQGLLEQGCVTVDEVVASVPSRRVLAGQRVSVLLRPTEQSRAFQPQAMELPIVHEDEDLIVIDKPAGWVVHPAPGNWSGTLLNGLLAHHAGASSLPRAGIVHRLDKDTTGLMVVGKTTQAVTALSRAIAQREVRRDYLALAQGAPSRRSFCLDAPIGRDARVRVRMAVTAAGRAARTDVRVLAGARTETMACSLLHCRLHTGRTHQIRVHLSHAGHPLVGDALYGGAPLQGLARQALHAAWLGLRHPRSGELMQWHAPLPEDLAAVVAWLWPSWSLPETPPSVSMG